MVGDEVFSGQYAAIPERMRPGLLRYINQHIPTGSFLRAVLENNLKGAVFAADDENLQLLPLYVRFVYGEGMHGPRVPAEAKGSVENVKNWLKKIRQ